ncbi:hypothetical protein GCM10010449_57550 [Streptomyces rectiviolaceus]|uniref:Uncharacterized protein n=1 Tax=Streptomyces rectiviolaceus TaxID=332591 RepID=A0ABP6MWR2_9ACTN
MTEGVSQLCCSKRGLLVAAGRQPDDKGVWLLSLVGSGPARRLVMPLEGKVLRVGPAAKDAVAWLVARPRAHAQLSWEGK